MFRTCVTAALTALLVTAAIALAQPDPAMDTYCNGCNDIGKRNIELGSNQDPNGDIAAVGRLAVCYDLCAHGFVIMDGEGARGRVMLRVGHRCVWIVGHRWCRQAVR